MKNHEKPAGDIYLVPELGPYNLVGKFCLSRVVAAICPEVLTIRENRK
jgi:hypothetical protein